MESARENLQVAGVVSGIVAGVLGLTVLARAAERPESPVVRCVDGKVPEHAGFIAAVAALNDKEDLGMGGATVIDRASELQKLVRAEDRQAQTHEWFQLGINENGKAISATLGPCPSPSTPPSS
jgi:hypothetical protein